MKRYHKRRPPKTGAHVKNACYVNPGKSTRFVQVGRQGGRTTITVATDLGSDAKVTMREFQQTTSVTRMIVVCKVKLDASSLNQMRLCEKHNGLKILLPTFELGKVPQTCVAQIKGDNPDAVTKWKFAIGIPWETFAARPMKASGAGEGRIRPKTKWHGCTIPESVGTMWQEEAAPFADTLEVGG